MKENDLLKKLENIFGSKINDEDIDSINRIIRDEGIDTQKLDDLIRLGSLLDMDIKSDDCNSMDSRFYSMLEDEKDKASGTKTLQGNRTWIRIAAGIALFISGWIGSQLISNSSGKQLVVELSGEVAELKETLVIAKLEQDSPSQRIQAVNMVMGMEDLDETLAMSLLSVLNKDPNTNVRLVALETLVNYSDNPIVREGMIKAITNQESPLVQLRLAEIMVELEEKSSVPEFRKILEDLTLDYLVRTRINETVNVLL